jgi:NosR/NirI family transcriptional regulator, nitrous oxide reductase regulator
MRKTVTLIMVIVLPVAGGFLGRFASPELARVHYTVRLAERVRLEQTTTEAGSTLESDAFRASGEKAEDLFAEAAAIRKQFALGSVILGAWCGLAFALNVFGLNRSRRREIYEVNYDICVSCGRCFMSCPRERLRLKQIQEKDLPSGKTP